MWLCGIPPTLVSWQWQARSPSLGGRGVGTKFVSPFVSAGICEQNKLLHGHLGSLVTGNAGISWSKCFNKRSPVRIIGSVSKQVCGHSWFECGWFIFQQCLSTDTSCNFEILGGFVGFLRNSGDYWQKFSLRPPAVVSERLQISFKFCGNFILISQVIHASLCFEKELFGNLGI